MNSMSIPGDMLSVSESIHRHVIARNAFPFVMFAVENKGLQMATYWFNANKRIDSILLVSDKINGATKARTINKQCFAVLISKCGNRYGEL